METSSQKLIRPSAQERSLFLLQFQILLSPKKCLTMVLMETRRTAWALEAVKLSIPLIFIKEALLQLGQTPNFKVQWEQVFKVVLLTIFIRMKERPLCSKEWSVKIRVKIMLSISCTATQQSRILRVRKAILSLPFRRQISFQITSTQLSIISLSGTTMDSLTTQTTVNQT
jgi:hypothetical protein